MNPKRRRFLEILGVGGVGGLAGCSSFFESSATGERTSQSDNTPTATQPQTDTLDTSSRVRSALEGRRETYIDPDFSYEPMNQKLENSDLFSQVHARPASGKNGDYLQLRPATQPPTELASLLREVWNVGTELTTTTTVAETGVRFSGGEAFGTTYLVGTAALDPTTVVVVRASTPDVAVALAESGVFPLDQ